MKRRIKCFMTVCLIVCIGLNIIEVVLPGKNPSVVYAAAGSKNRKVTINKKKINVVKGKTVKLHATVKPIGYKKYLKWESKKPKVASVNNKGKVKAKKLGTAKIIAYIKKKAKKNESLPRKAICKVTIKKPESAAASSPAVTVIPSVTSELSSAAITEVTAAETIQTDCLTATPWTTATPAPTTVIVTEPVTLPPAHISFSVPEGIYSDDFELSIISDTDDTVIYYTLDGTEPSEDLLGNGTNLYEKPIKITDASLLENYYSMMQVYVKEAADMKYPSEPVPKCTILRVLAIDSLGVHEFTKSYFIFKDSINPYSLPIFSITGDSEDLFGSEGLYVKNGNENEVPVYMEMYDKNGEIQISQKCGVKIHGGGSVSLLKKSLRFYARNEYDPEKSKFDYEFFPNIRSRTGGRIKSFKRILLRSSGQDSTKTMFKCAFNNTLIKDSKADTQAASPAVLYINGEFWGFTNIRERIDEHYIASHYPVDKDKVAIVGHVPWMKNLPKDTFLVNGDEEDKQAYLDLWNYIGNNDMSDTTHYSYVKTQMDIDNFIDYSIVQIYMHNWDGWFNNLQAWRIQNGNPDSNVPGYDGKWRWIVYDTDITLGYAPQDFFKEMYNSNSTYYKGMHFLRNLLENNSFKEKFLTRFDEMLDTTLSSANALKVYEEYKNKVIPVLPYEFIRFPGNIVCDAEETYLNKWLKNCSYSTDFISSRPTEIRKQLKSHFNYE